MLEKNPDTLKVVYKAFPLRSHQMALPAVKAALAANKQGRFWDFHDKIFADLRGLDQQKLNQIATDLGLDMASFARDLGDRDIQQMINRDLRDGQTSGVTGTPTLFVNGFRVENRSPEGIQDMIDRELRKLGKGK